MKRFIIGVIVLGLLIFIGVESAVDKHIRSISGLTYGEDMSGKSTEELKKDLELRKKIIAEESGPGQGSNPIFVLRQANKERALIEVELLKRSYGHEGRMLGAKALAEDKYKHEKWQNEFVDVCQSNDYIYVDSVAEKAYYISHYCENIGKKAYNNYANPYLLRGGRIGEKITGLIWRPKGSVIGVDRACPAAGYPNDIARRSQKDEFYYIIVWEDGRKFLRLCGEIDVK